jgi:hypothetical protein
VQHSAAIQQKGAVVKKIATIAFLVAFLIVLPVARADESDQATKVTFNQPVQIPGRILPAGTYWFILPQDVHEHYQVRIFNSDRTMIYATLLTIDAERLQPTGNSNFTFTEHGSAHLKAIVTWFYPGRQTGHEFLYPQQVSNKLAKDKQTSIVAGD